MTLTIDPVLERALNETAKHSGILPEDVVLNTLREKFAVPISSIQPKDDWERRLLGMATSCGVSPTEGAFNRDTLYD